jgi:DNA-binding response OmpR family regulator
VSSRILVVEDDRAIADAVAYSLEAAGHEADVVHDGEGALHSDLDRYDLLVLDVMLPGISGIEVCRRVRGRSIAPILMLTARNEELDRVLGLEAGADDYVGKPFSMPELLSRVRAMLRRRALDQASHAPLRLGRLELDLVHQTARVNGQPIGLTPSEFRLLALLVSRPDHVFTRNEIVDHVSRGSLPPDDRIADTHVKNIRRKLGSGPGDSPQVVTVRGVGYMLRTA